MMYSVQQEALEWVGTPYHDEMHHKQQGTDCIGLLRGVARHTGYFSPSQKQMPPYGRFPSDHIAERSADRFMEVVGHTWQHVKPGYCGLFWWRDKNHGQHFAIFVEEEGRAKMVHAFMNNEKVVKHEISDFWRKRLMKVYRFRVKP